jgi:hypothetical protein
MIVTRRIAVLKNNHRPARLVKKSRRRTPFAKSSVRLGRMTHTGCQVFSEDAAESLPRGGEVYRRLWALHAQFAEVQAKDELSGTVPAGDAREGPKLRYGEAPTANAAGVGQGGGRDVRTERAPGLLKRNHPSLFTPFLVPETADFCPVAQILRSGELRCEWTMLVPNEVVIRHGQTMARAIHAGSSYSRSNLFPKD